MAKQFTFFWLTGDREVLEGSDPANALNNAGYGGGAIAALDFYSEGDDDGYRWDGRKWIKDTPTESLKRSLADAKEGKRLPVAQMWDGIPES
ncbi:MAG TPA: hypothetical protein V6C57_21070 [Coleofasciculaceae cyanobacterium]